MGKLKILDILLFKVYNQDIGKVDNCYIVFCIILCYGGDVVNVLVIFTPSVTAYNNGNYNVLMLKI